MLARTFRSALQEGADVVVYASGVSNSQCRDEREFERERMLLESTLQSTRDRGCFVYFSTCSVDDPESADTPYVRHKLQMEHLTRTHPQHLVLRLPQVVGRTPNPHTLVNYLYARIARGERFSVWRRARRNVIDCDDVGSIAAALLATGLRRDTVNIANVRSYPILDIVETLERVAGGHAVYDIVERGGAWDIDVSRMIAVVGDVARFDDGYLERVLRKYYG